MAFPSTALLSEFDCVTSPENPLYEDGAWIRTTGDRPPMQKIGIPPNCAATDSEHGNPNYSSWGRATYLADLDENIVEVWGCIEGGQLGAALETWRVFAFLEGVEPTGYLLYEGGGIGKALVLRRYTGGITSFIDIGGSSIVYPPGIGLRINGTQIEAWYSTGDPLDPNDWALSHSVTDPTHRGNFRIGIAVEDPTAGGLGFSCFGGGKPPSAEFIRWLRVELQGL